MPLALTGALWFKGGHGVLPGWPCPLRALTGLPCPTCFLTRATAAALRGDLTSSIQLHTFGPLLAAGLLAWSLWALRQRRLWPQRWPHGRATLLLGATLLGYWGLRLQASFGNTPSLAGLAFPPS